MIIDKQVTGFLDFIRERGVAGLAVGFVMGTSVQKVVNSFVEDLLNPLIGMMTGSAQSLSSLKAGPFAVGNFISTVLNFLILALVIYLVFKVLGLDKIDKKNS